jgi:hypothetical protein
VSLGIAQTIGVEETEHFFIFCKSGDGSSSGRCGVVSRLCEVPPVSYSYNGSGTLISVFSDTVDVGFDI